MKETFVTLLESYFLIEYVDHEVLFSTVESINFPPKLLADFTISSINEGKLNSLYGLCTVLQSMMNAFLSELPTSCKYCYFHTIFRLTESSLFSAVSFFLH